MSDQYNHKKTIYLILAIALIIHIVQAVQAIGYFHPDQHFSIIEFASYKLGFSSADQMAWEFPNKVRSTIQVYLFLGYYNIMEFFGLGDAFASLTVLRIIVVLLNYFLFNYIILMEFKKSRRSLLIIVLLVANFSWIFPYYKTLYNSENFGAIFFFGSILLYQFFTSRSLKTGHSILIGFLLSLSFYFRFQMGFAIIGLGVWFLFYEKVSFKHILALSTGFLIGIGLNTVIDSLYYGDFNFTPFTNLKINTVGGRAATTGTSPIWYYIVDLAVVLSAPFLSFIFLYFVFKGFIKKFNNPYVLSVIFFLFFHFLIGHKEERFLFPIFGILPVILGYGLERFQSYQLKKDKPGLNWYTHVIVAFSIILNFTILYFVLSVPYSQPIHFIKEINQYFSKSESTAKVICYHRSPYELSSGNFHSFYWHFRNKRVLFQTIDDKDDFEKAINNPPPDTYFAITYDRMVNNTLTVLEKENTLVMTSSKKASNLNRWLYKKDLFIIPDIWLLFKPDKKDD